MSDSDHGPDALTSQGQLLENQPFDEAFEVHNAETIVTPVPSVVRSSPVNAISPLSSASPLSSGIAASSGMDGYGRDGSGLDGSLSGGDDYDRGDTPPEHGYNELDGDGDYDENSNLGDHDDLEDDYGGGAIPKNMGGGDNKISGDDDESDDIHWAGEYTPAQFAHLRVEDDIKDLFECISQYKPHIADIETKLEPFIPDYIPAVGDIDAMIKIPRGDGVDLGLGLEIVDEPCAAQSDPTVLDLQLRSISKTTSIKAVEVKQIANPAETPKALDNWITSITELHREKPPQTIQYSTAMPDLELLMQEWPEEVEEQLRSVGLPGADLEVPLNVYVSIVCALLDIPIHKSKIEALHVLFSLFVEFKNSQHFRTEEEADALNAADPVADAEPDVMVL